MATEASQGATNMHQDVPLCGSGGLYPAIIRELELGEPGVVNGGCDFPFGQDQSNIHLDHFWIFGGQIV